MVNKKQKKKQTKQEKVVQEQMAETAKPKEAFWTPARKKALWPLAMAVILFLLVWKEPEVVAMDPWNSVAKILDSAARSQAGPQRDALLEESSEILELEKKYPRHARVQFLTGFYYYIQHKWDSAIVHEYEAFRLDSGAIINPVWPDAARFLSSSIINKATILIGQGKKKEAFDLLQKGLSADPYEPGLNKLMGNLYINSDQYTNAIKYYETSLAKNPNDADIYNNIGVIFTRTGETEKARQCFMKALELNPNHPNARQNLQAHSQK